MSRLRSLALTAVGVVLVLTPAAASGVARADPPAPGDECTVLHATTRDANDRLMWCNPTMTGPHTLVWQYGGPS
jgi:hypothetical protein